MTKKILATQKPDVRLALDPLLLGKWIKYVRTTLGLSSKEAAKYCHVGQHAFSALELGKGTTTLKNLFNALNGLNIKLICPDSKDHLALEDLSIVEIGNLIKLKRESNGQSYSYAARAMGISRSSLLNIQQGKGLNSNSLFQVLDYFEIKLYVNPSSGIKHIYGPDIPTDMLNTNEDIAKWVGKTRRTNGLTLTDAARLCNVSRVTFIHVEHGRDSVLKENVEKVIDGLKRLSA